MQNVFFECDEKFTLCMLPYSIFLETVSTHMDVPTMDERTTGQLIVALIFSQIFQYFSSIRLINIIITDIIIIETRRHAVHPTIHCFFSFHFIRLQYYNMSRSYQPVKWNKYEPRIPHTFTYSYDSYS